MSIDEGVEYRRDEIVPIPAQCTGALSFLWGGRRHPKSRHDWIGRDAIRAPSLRGCLCFYCGSPLVPHPDMPPVIDAETRRKMQESDAAAPPIAAHGYQQTAMVTS